jgi:hypothetical protein
MIPDSEPSHANDVVWPALRHPSIDYAQSFPSGHRKTYHPDILILQEPLIDPSTLPTSVYRSRYSKSC